MERAPGDFLDRREFFDFVHLLLLHLRIPRVFLPE